MKKTVKETLKQAVEQLFVRIHGDLFHAIYKKDKGEFQLTQIVYDDQNEAHVELVKLCKEKIGYQPTANSQDIFYSILSVYVRGIEEEKDKKLQLQNPTDLRKE